MTKREKKPALSTKSSFHEKGQLSIFLGISLTIIITLLAFIINVGLFVKAKINLQNAVDAAAWSGAAVQARQLTNIAYLNWEIRNVYKEWMFKYYVLGQLGIQRTNPAVVLANDNVSYRLRQFDESLGLDPDPYNVPTICIHYGGANNICDIYNVPGLPRFPSHNIPGISHRLEKFISEIRDEKSRACVHRSIVNQTTATLWTYGTGNPNIFEGIPLVMFERPGAWPQSLELAFRMRNLEAMVNRAPVTQGICHPSNQDCSGGVYVDDPGEFMSDIHPIHERPVKAFMSAWRNLSGGFIKDQGSDEFATSFILKELAPTPFDAPADSLSGLLIPDSAQIASEPALRKYYLDLLINPVNYAILYTSFIPTTDSEGDTVSQETEEGACHSSKTGLPVPAYISGFTKNSNVLTYYAVKGEAKFQGLFYPFHALSPDGIQLSAYGAAKPFGGRIGPRNFSYLNDPDKRGVYPRPNDGDVMSRTSTLISGIEIPTGVDFNPGDLLPFDQDFWLESNDVAGGRPIGGSPVVTGDNPKFGIPNMIYDFRKNNFDELNDAAQHGNDPLFTLKRATNLDPIDPNAETVGLYNPQQFIHLRDRLVADIPDDGAVDRDLLLDSIYHARAPTLYDALNYLIPTLSENNNSVTPGVVRLLDDGKHYELYAPLLDAGGVLLYQEAADLVNRANALIQQNFAAIDNYIAALKNAAERVRDIGEEIVQDLLEDDDAYIEAYRSIHPLEEFDDSFSGPCESMAEKMLFFFQEQNQAAGCEGNIVPLQELLTLYFSDIGNDPAQRTFLRAPYYPMQRADDATMDDLHTAYMPGSRSGASEDGRITRPSTGDEAEGLSRRNFYSTKFVPVSNLLDSPVGNAHYSDFPLHYETSDPAGQDEFNADTHIFKNILRIQDLEEFQQVQRLRF